MKIQLRGRQIDWTEPLRRHAGRRVSFALSRFSQSISVVTVDHRRDVGTPEGFQKACRITVNLLPKGSVLVQDTGEDLYAAISQLADQAARAVGRALERERDWAAGPPPSKASGVSKP